MATKTVTLNCVADTHTAKLYPDTNYGSFNELTIGGGYGDSDWVNSHAWIRFGALPSDFSWDNFISMSLELYVSYYDPEDTTRFGFQKPDAYWDENTITWNNHPTLQEGFKSEEKYMNYNGWYEFQFTKNEFENCINTSNQPDMRMACSVYSPGHICSIVSRDHPTEWGRPKITLTYESAEEEKMTNILCDDVEVGEGRQYYIAAQLIEALHPYNPVEGKLIDFYIDDVCMCSDMTDSGGNAYCDPGAGAPRTAGTYTILADWVGDSGYGASSGSGTLTILVNQCTQTITVQTDDGSSVLAMIDYGDGGSYSANTPFTRTHDYTEGNTYTITATADGREPNSHTFTACTEPVTLTLTPPLAFRLYLENLLDDVGVFAGEDTYDLPGAEIEYYRDDPILDNLIGTTTTNPDRTFGFNVDREEYDINIYACRCFGVLGCEDTVECKTDNVQLLGTTKIDTKISCDDKTSTAGQNVELSAKLETNTPPWFDIPDKTIHFFVDDVEMGSDDTDEDGMAYVTVVAQEGTYEIKAVFDGDDDCNTSSDTATLTVSVSDGVVISSCIPTEIPIGAYGVGFNDLNIRVTVTNNSSETEEVKLYLTNKDGSIIIDAEGGAIPYSWQNIDPGESHTFTVGVPSEEYTVLSISKQDELLKVECWTQHPEEIVDSVEIKITGEEFWLWEELAELFGCTPEGAKKGVVYGGVGAGSLLFIKKLLER